MLILKSYYDKLDERDYNKTREELFNYGSYLEDKGWKENIIEGGYVSPDYSTIFITNRDPYFGQLLQFSSKEQEFKKIIKELEKDFVCVPY